MGTIIQSIFCAQSGASIRSTVWKWSSESRYTRALPPVLENFRRAFSPCPTVVPNAKRTKQLLIATQQKLKHVNQPTFDLYLNGNRVAEAEDEKLLGVRIDSHLTWHSHIEYLIGKLNSRTYLLIYFAENCYLMHS